MDAGFSQVKDICGSESPCEIGEGDVEIEITEEMGNAMKAELRSYYREEDFRTEDEQAALDAELEVIDTRFGTLEPLPALVYTRLSDSEYDHKIEFSPGGDQAELYGSTATKISYKQDYDMTSIDPSLGSGYDLFNYDDEAQLSSSVHHSYDSVSCRCRKYELVAPPSGSHCILTVTSSSRQVRLHELPLYPHLPSSERFLN